MKPRLETPADRARQDRARDIIAESWNCEMFDFPTNSPVDWKLLRDGCAFAVGEFKSRITHRWGDFENIYVPAAKVIALTRFAASEKLRRFFFVEFDGIRFLDLDKVTLGETEMRGREDRGWKNDIEPCHLVHLNHFELV